MVLNSFLKAISEFWRLPRLFLRVTKVLTLPRSVARNANAKSQSHSLWTTTIMSTLTTTFQSLSSKSQSLMLNPLSWLLSQSNSEIISRLPQSNVLMNINPLMPPWTRAVQLWTPIARVNQAPAVTKIGTVALNATQKQLTRNMKKTLALTENQTAKLCHKRRPEMKNQTWSLLNEEYLHPHMKSKRVLHVIFFISSPFFYLTILVMPKIDDFFGLGWTEWKLWPSNSDNQPILSPNNYHFLLSVAKPVPSTGQNQTAIR